MYNVHHSFSIMVNHSLKFLNAMKQVVVYGIATIV